MTLEALSREKHRDLRLRPVEHPWAFARTMVTAAVVGAELPELVRTMPIAFRQQEGRASMVALMGLGRENLCVGPQGEWLGRYIPAVLRAWPFALAPRGSEHVVVVNSDSPVLSRETGDPLFDAEGKPTERLQKILDFLKLVGDQDVVIARAVAAIADAGLFVPWDIELRNEVGKRVRVTGLHQVSREAFDALDDEAFLTLRRAGALPLIYGHWFSQRNISELERLMREQSKRREQPAAGGQEAQPLYITDDYLKF